MRISVRLQMTEARFLLWFILTIGAFYIAHPLGLVELFALILSAFLLSVRWKSIEVIESDA